MFNQSCLIYLERNLSNNNSISGARTTADPINGCSCSYLNAAPTCSIRLLYTFSTVDKSGGRKIRAWNYLDQIFDTDVRIGYQSQGGFYYLSDIVRRNLGCHANRYPIRSVNQ